MSVVVALVPVSVFLLLLVLFDSFKLVPKLMLARALAMGAGAAVIMLPLHAWLQPATGLSATAFSRYVAPVTEETLKLLCLIYPLRRRQIGFLVDAAIIGFAIGAGFALVENIDYLQRLAQASPIVWMVRGFGTAVLHATTPYRGAREATGLADPAKQLA